MLRFILGKSGTGKTTYICKQIAALVNEGNKNIIMLVPDQSSFETEKSFLNLLGAKKAKQISVFGFSKLCRYAFEQTGNIPENVIDSGTRSVIMNLALEQLTEKLKLFNSKNSRNVSDIMLQTLTECKKNGISTDMLRQGAEKVGDNTLKTKLYETSLVLDTFDALVSQSYIDPLDDLTRLYNILLENNIFSDYILFVDSFSGFTAQQLKVLRLLLNRTREAYIALTLDPLSRGNEDVFATSYKTLRTITDIAKRDFIEVKKPIELNECKRFKSKELALLEGGIFRNDFEKEETNPQSIKLYTAADINDECEYVAKQIKRLVIEEGYLYSDISVITYNTDLYSGILNVVFDKYEIPYFMDIKKDIEVKPVIRFINSLFRMVLNNFEREDVMSFLKTGLTGNTPEEISVFENYAYVWNISNSAFKSEFSQNPRGFSDEFSECDLKNLATAEKVRKSVIEPALAFRTECKDKNGREITELLYKLMLDMGVQDALNTMYEAFEGVDNSNLGAEQIRIYNMFIEVLDKMVAVVGDTQLSLNRYFELLSIQISSMQLSEIPQLLDSVTVTTAQRVRLSNQRVSFLIGCIDGIFPAVPHTSGVFSSFELKILSLNDISISEDFADLNNLETFMAYCCMTSASEKLFFSYPHTDLLGEQYSKSVIIDEVCKVFPKIIAEDSLDINSPENSMWAMQPAFEKFAAAMRSNKSRLQELSAVFENDEHYAVKIEALSRAVDNSPFQIKSRENTHSLFSDNLNISATQIEKFNLCRFSYFCNYGLRVRERQRAEINPLEYGTLVHFILDKFFSEFSKKEYSNLNKSDISDFVHKAMLSYIEQYFGGSDTKTRSFLYRLSVLEENLCILLEHIIKEISQSDFEVADCELKIGSDIPAYTIKLPTGENVLVKGSIDRVDIMEKDGIKYLRVIDYKTGPKTFKLSDILYGLNLQMLLYLYSVKQNGTSRYGDIIPAGILYMPATAPIISADKSVTEEAIEAALDKDLKMNGFLLNDVKVIRGMDKTEKGRYIPAVIKVDTPVSKRSLGSLEEFGKIFGKIDLLVTQMGEELYNGKIEASPAKGAHDACEYCPYDSVCAYHMSEIRNTFDVDNDEVYKKIDEELADGGEQK